MGWPLSDRVGLNVRVGAVGLSPTTSLVGAFLLGCTQRQSCKAAKCKISESSDPVQEKFTLNSDSVIWEI